ncbi:MAG TPA: hypothetical protein VLS90_03255 [Thermodesulfobacteriota bacterium]|nr:hypothetical protein [Thermodesulfobacteriota bacterium]
MRALSRRARPLAITLLSAAFLQSCTLTAAELGAMAVGGTMAYKQGVLEVSYPAVRPSVGSGLHGDEKDAAQGNWSPSSPARGE